MAIYAGIMSGTSLDGIDIAFADIAVVAADAERPRFKVNPLGYGYSPYPEETSAILEQLRSGVELPISVAAQLHYHLGSLYADAVLDAAGNCGLAMSEVAAVGLHGQTVWHAPPGVSHPWPHFRPAAPIGATLQIGQPAVVAERTGCNVIADFRAADVAAEGQGAPLVPFADYILLADEVETRVILNIGGIANLTFLPAGANPAQTIAFDTGPGMMAVDAVCRSFGLGCDNGGVRSAQGCVNEEVVAAVLNNPYFRLKPPKSTGAELFGGPALAIWVERNGPFTPNDRLATAAAVTARSIAMSIDEYLPRRPDRIILGGGGSKNRAVVDNLAALLPGVLFSTHEDYGISSDGKEALAFAILAAAHDARIPANLPSVTGAKGFRVLGATYPSPIPKN